MILHKLSVLKEAVLLKPSVNQAVRENNASQFMQAVFLHW